MAWTSPRTWVANAVLTAAQLNTDVRDNLNETAAAKATTAGYFFVATGSNSIAERAIEEEAVNTNESTASTSFTDLATAGPSITATTGTKALVMVQARMSNDTAGLQAWMGVEVSGASAVSPVQNRSLVYESSNAGDTLGASAFWIEDSLTGGSNVFTSKYRVDTGGTGSFAGRRLFVMAL